MWFTLHKIQGSYGNLRPSFITRSVVINARYTFVQGVRKQRSGDKNCCYWRVVVCLKMKGNIFLFSSHKYIMHENSSSPIEPMKWICWCGIMAVTRLKISDWEMLYRCRLNKSNQTLIRALWLLDEEKKKEKRWLLQFGNKTVCLVRSEKDSKVGFLCKCWYFL